MNLPGLLTEISHLVAVGIGPAQWSGGREGSHLPAPTDPGVTVSRHPAPVIAGGQKSQA
jgi:hypothetical protein